MDQTGLHSVVISKEVESVESVGSHEKPVRPTTLPLATHLSPNVSFFLGRLRPDTTTDQLLGFVDEV
jgi:hypothetical protein